MAKQTLCNMCGRVINERTDTCDFSIHTTLGYSSRNDGMRLDFDLCATCEDALIGELSAKCKIPPLSGDDCWEDDYGDD